MLDFHKKYEKLLWGRKHVLGSEAMDLISMRLCLICKKIREIALGKKPRAWELSNGLNSHEIVLDLHKK